MLRKNDITGSDVRFFLVLVLFLLCASGLSAYDGAPPETETAMEMAIVGMLLFAGNTILPLTSQLPAR